MKFLLAGLLVLLFNGCSSKIVQIEPINDDNIHSYNIFGEWGPEPKKHHYYKLFGTYNNSESNLKKLQAILKNQKEKYSKIKDTFKSKLTHLSYDEKYKYCYIQVIGRQYGSFRNVIERDSLIDRCISDIRASRKIYNTGIQYKAHLFSPNYLNIDIKFGQGRQTVETWQNILIKPIDDKLYFFMTMSKNYMKTNLFVHDKFLSDLYMMIKESNLISDNPMIVKQEDFLLKD